MHKSDDLDSPFVVNYFIDYGEDGETDFKIFLSTSRLLRLTSLSETLHADATYKCLLNGCPVLICGTSDKKFHPSGLSVCYHERAIDFDFIFQATKSGIDDELGKDYQSDTLLADGAYAITNGFKNTFPNSTTRVMTTNTCF